MYYAPNISGEFPEVEEVDIDFGHHGFISPTQDYLLVYTRIQENEERNDSDIYVCFKEKGGTWTEPINLGDDINSSLNDGAPRITPDGKYFFFTRSDKDRDLSTVYWVSTDVIENLRPRN